MKVQLHSTKNGEPISNHTYAHQMYGADFEMLTIRDIDEKYTPINLDGFFHWQHAIAINGKKTWFCISR